MIFDVIRFNLFALDLLREEVRTGKEMSIGQYLDREGYGDGFKEDYLFVRIRFSPDLVAAADPKQAYDRCNLVNTGRQSGSRLSCIHTHPILPQPSPSSAHGKTKVVDS